MRTRVARTPTPGRPSESRQRRCIMNRLVAAVIASILGIGLAGCSYASPATPLPDPVVDTPLAGVSGMQTAVLAGGCFWGMEGVFEHVKGVTRVVSGYAGGNAVTVMYCELWSCVIV